MRKTKGSNTYDSRGDIVDHLENRQRSKKFKLILSGRCDEQVSPIIMLKSFAGVLLGIAVTSSITLLPQHNVIEKPKYWYESMYGLAIGYPAAASGYIAYTFFYLLNMQHGVPWKMALCIFLFTILW